jgi:hypothetical protein
MMMFNKWLAIMTDKHNGKGRSLKFKVVFLLLPILIVVFAIYSYKKIIPCPKERIQQDVQKLFLEIKQMPNSTPVEALPRSSYRYCHAITSNQYKGKATDQEVRKYYDDELAKHGWVFQKETNVTIWGHDYGGKEFVYCKGEYTASIETSGQLAAENGWSYSFSISWGLYNCGSS